jgi:hypothetical protein
MTSPHAAIIADIEGWDARHGQLVWPDELFNAHVRAIFAHQYAHNKPYRAFCDGRGASPATVYTWRDVPAVPTDVFKHVRLTCADTPVRTFRTSGTTQGARGAHHMGTLDVYRASLRGPFMRFMLPDAPPPMRVIALIPHPAALPDSSLSFMAGELEQDGWLWAVTPTAGFDHEAIYDALSVACDAGEPVMLLGTAFAFAEVIEQADARNLRWALPAGSRLMETGGFKGRGRELTREAFYAALTDTFGIPAWACVAEYSMTELSSQAYTDTLFHVKHGQPWLPARLVTPPWARMEIVDPTTLEPYDTRGVAGLIRWIDLANTESVLAVQTSDLGIKHDDGSVTLLGRAPDAALRGCSLTIEEIVGAG